MHIIDIFYTLKWWFAFLLIGFAFLPSTFYLFKILKDQGYIFSKIIGIAVISYVVFILGLLKIVKFSSVEIYILIIIFLLINYYLFRKDKVILAIKTHFKIFFIEEIIFLISLFFWTYIRGTLPDIHGLEKFMDFGFLNSILRSDYFPPKDMWYTPFTINYYYFGHLVTAVLTKFSLIPSYITFNLMLATLFGITFTASLSLGINLFDNKYFSLKSIIAGFLSTIFISLGGNLTTIYSFFKPYIPADQPVPLWQLPFQPFSFPNNYWYPNATRFIPFTIHEFPIYSFVVSDLHGHVLDIPFVILTIAVIYVFFISQRINIKNLVFLSFLFAIMYMTNAWDGLIYLLLGILFLAIYIFYLENNKRDFSQDNFKKFFIGVSTLTIGFIIFIIPFSINFKPFVSGIGVICAPTFLTNIGKLGPFLFEANHCQKSPIWQLITLYGFFYFFVLEFIAFLKFKKNYQLSRNDLFILLMITLATFLIIVPEFIYVKDIYPTYYRANTMFKLVYEAFIMLSFSSAYILIKLLFNIKQKKYFLPFLITSAVLLFFILIYPYFAINSYYNNLKNYQGLDGIKYLSNLYPGDYDLINWINKNINGQPVVLEANGDSYTDYARISANTGLPTIIGWPVHEWLWRGSWDYAAPRIADVETLYSTPDLNTARKLIEKYNISYVVISGLEKQKYPNINEKTFQTLGKIIYKNGETKLYKII